QSLWAYRGSIMAMGARFISSAASSNAVQNNSVGDTAQLSSSFAANASTTRLLRVQGALSDSHLRAAAFDVYKDGTWVPPLSKRTMKAALPRETNEEKPDAERTRRSTVGAAKFTVLRDTGGVVFLPLNAWAILPEEGQGFDWDRFQGPVKIDEPTPVSYYVIDSRKEAYDFLTEQGPLAVSLEQTNKEVPAVEDWDQLAQTRAALMTVPPEIDPQVTQLARDIARGGVTQAEKAAKIVDYLFTTNKYSLEFVRGSQDPISDFVLNKKGGHCQYFASAATMMLRSVGIPARYVTGYYAHERDDDGATIVRGRDAHAWTEAYFRGIGWVRLDATPPSGRADPAVSPLPPYQKSLERAQDAFARVRNWFGNLTQLQILGIVVVILTLWGLERWRQNRKIARKRAQTPLPPPQLAPLARRFERLLAKRGITLVAGRPWSETLPDELQNERGWVEGYNRARFDEVEDSEIRELEQELRKLEK
ncbi:MAG: transglutaminase-like domain-containing protein, partial [Armatimonadetes bacterium]|nr:transglutaminase-like domain-containing protein [Armatimonadota bacterium]